MRGFGMALAIFIGTILGCNGDKLDCGEGTYEVDGECVPGSGWSGTGGTLETAPIDWIGAGPVTSLYQFGGFLGSSLPDFDEENLAWRITHGGCVADSSDLLCEYRVFLTAEIGRNCRRCEDQTVDVKLRFTGAGQILLDTVKLVEGDGLPIDFTFEDLDLPLTPKGPHDENEVNLLSGQIFSPLGLEYVYAGWVMMDSNTHFVDASGRDYENCLSFAYTEPPGEFDGDFVVRALDGPLQITACSGVGIVQVDGSVPGPMIRSW